MIDAKVDSDVDVMQAQCIAVASVRGGFGFAVSDTDKFFSYSKDFVIFAVASTIPINFRACSHAGILVMAFVKTYAAIHCVP